ncbi:hypothetical protein MMC17_003808 [Xylographa soralifera]|nr:hypothetical protein [Xylographa soralifera]
MATAGSANMTAQGVESTQAAASVSQSTSFLAAETGLSTENLPNVFFQLEPFDSWRKTNMRPLTDRKGNVVRNHQGQQLQEFEFLPARISIRPEAWRLLLYTDRSHPHCGAKDLYARMQPAKGEEVLNPNAINMQKVRLRNALNVPCWNRRHSEPTIVECLMHEQYSWLSVVLNTTLPVGPTGLIKPAPPVAEGTTAIPPEILPFTTFLEDGADGVREPSTRLKKIFSTVAGLQDTAYDKGYAHWIFLENKDKPLHWSFRAQSQRHARARPDDVSVPTIKAMPLAAVAWIEFCIRDAAAVGSILPAPEKLPTHAADWINNVISENTFSVITEGSEVAEYEIFTQVEAQNDDDEQGNASHAHGNHYIQNQDLPRGQNGYNNESDVHVQQFVLKELAELEDLIDPEEDLKGLKEYEGSEVLDLEAYDAELDVILEQCGLNYLMG